MFPSTTGICMPWAYMTLPLHPEHNKSRWHPSPPWGSHSAAKCCLGRAPAHRPVPDGGRGDTGSRAADFAYWFPPPGQILVLESVPDINLLDYLPEILDGLFQILGDNGKEIRKM